MDIVFFLYGARIEYLEVLDFVCFLGLCMLSCWCMLYMCIFSGACALGNCISSTFFFAEVEFYSLLAIFCYLGSILYICQACQFDLLNGHYCWWLWNFINLCGCKKLVLGHYSHSLFPCFFLHLVWQTYLSISTVDVVDCFVGSIIDILLTCILSAVAAKSYLKISYCDGWLSVAKSNFLNVLYKVMYSLKITKHSFNLASIFFY